MSWQPIETAPKDGDIYFLVHWPTEGHEIVSPRYYAELVANGEPAATHWMPLPDPPEVKS